MYIRSFLLGLLTLVLTVGLVGCDSGGTPGAGSVGDSTSVVFSEPEAVVGEGDGSYAIDVTITDPGFKEVPFEVALNTSQSTVTPGEDVMVPADTTIRFPESATSGNTKSLDIGVVDDDEFLEGEETVVLDLSVGDSVEATVGDVSQFVLTISENDKTVSTQEARNLESGSRAVVDGVVTRVKSDGVYLQDPAGALFVFDSEVPGEVSQGDSVRVDGSTTYFSGLFQLEEVGAEGVTVLTSDNELPDPKVVTLSELSNNGEQYESELVRVRDFGIDDGGDQSFGGGANYTVQDNSGSSTLRIPGGSELVGQDIPDRANFQGVLSQFNNFGAPSDNFGYQLLGLLQSDLEIIESVTINEARSKDLGTTVSLTGTVTRAFGAYVRIQDDSGPTGASAVVVRQTDGANSDAFQQDISDGTIQPGTTIRVTGALSQFSGLEQINGDDLASYDVVQQGSAPAPQTVSLTDVGSPDGEDYESELLRIENLSFQDPSGNFESGTGYTVEDGSGNTFTLRVQGSEESNVAGEPIPSGTFTFEGVLGQFNVFSGRGDDSGYQLLPIQPSDFQ